MPLLLPTIVGNRQKPSQPLLLLQSSLAQSCLPVLRHILREQLGHGYIVLLCTLHTPPNLVGNENVSANSNVCVLDWTAYVPGYQNIDLETKLLQVRNAVEEAPPGPMVFVIDSVDTLDEDFESTSVTYKFLLAVLDLVRARPAPSRLICHFTAPSPLSPLLRDVSFTQCLTHVIAHPPVLLTHIASAYLTPPPPASPPQKFWRIFIPMAERHGGIESLIFGPGGEGGGGGSTDDIIVEILVRGGGDSRRKGVERALEGWSRTRSGPCELSDLDSLKGVWGRKTALDQDDAPDPIRNLPFNLSLTPSQLESRSQVPLPYAHKGEEKSSGFGEIFYEPDSADDLDYEDPDEDLDI